MTPAEVLRIVNAYGAVLMDTAPMGSVHDVKLLPQPKPRIKQALLAALRTSSDPSMREQLRGEYASLSSFQDLSDEEAKALQTWNRVMGGQSSVTTRDGLKREAAEISGVGETVTAVLEKCAAECELLMDELGAAGFR
jgi:hypothetical protein